MPTTTEHSGRGRKLKAVTKYRPKQRRKQPPMRKTTKKGAYAKSKVKAMAIRRNPMVENKTRDTEDVLRDFLPQNGNGSTTNFYFRDTLQFCREEELRDNSLQFLPPMPVYAMRKGLENYQMIGQNIFAKYLVQKITIRFPQSNVVLNNQFGNNPQKTITPVQPQEYRLIHGFVPVKLATTASTSPNDNQVTMAFIAGHVEGRVRDYLNERRDHLRITPKRTSSLKILGDKRIRPNLSKMNTAPLRTEEGLSGTEYGIGSIPDVNLTVKWPMMKKLHYTSTANFDVGVGGNPPQNSLPGEYNNWHWHPFCVLVNVNFDELPVDTTRKLKLANYAYNTQLYFTDS